MKSAFIFAVVFSVLICTVFAIRPGTGYVTRRNGFNCDQQPINTYEFELDTKNVPSTFNEISIRLLTLGYDFYSIDPFSLSWDNGYAIIPQKNWVDVYEFKALKFQHGSDGADSLLKYSNFEAYFCGSVGSIEEYQALSASGQWKRDCVVQSKQPDWKTTSSISFSFVSAATGVSNLPRSNNYGNKPIVRLQFNGEEPQQYKFYSNPKAELSADTLYVRKYLVNIPESSSSVQQQTSQHPLVVNTLHKRDNNQYYYATNVTTKIRPSFYNQCTTWPYQYQRLFIRVNHFAPTYEPRCRLYGAAPLKFKQFSEGVWIAETNPSVEDTVLTCTLITGTDKQVSYMKVSFHDIPTHSEYYEDLENPGYDVIEFVAQI